MTTLQTIAPNITKAASKQTYYTIRFLADRERTADAYRAYAYFRWVDDTLDAEAASVEVQERAAFLARQKSLLEKCSRGESFQDPTAEEQMLIELVRRDHEKNSGLQCYLRNMMQVMEFDAKRRGRLISQAELNEYTRWLATAVTEAMHYFIGHHKYAPHDETRYLAVTGAHITHMLRDTFDDMQAGYYNIPREVLESRRIGPHDVHSPAYRAWVRIRIQLARRCFRAGRQYLVRVQEPRCRLAGFAYSARFEWLLDTIEKESYVLRPQYIERKSFATGLRMGLSTFSALVTLRKLGKEATAQSIVARPVRER
ncbi:MAG TPA: squalene/phytoene synthase family protein [Anaerolineales bacterium]